MYDITDDGSCIRIRLNGEIVAIVEDYYFGGHVHAAIRQLLEENTISELLRSPLYDNRELEDQE